jgi:hypothetical protein
MSSARLARGALLMGVLLSASAAFLAAGCSSEGPQVSGTKTDWLRPCTQEADCETERDLSCLCGVCTARCTMDADCAPGVCGSPILTNAKCGNESEFVARGEQLCLPEEQPTCLVSALPRDASLGAAVPVSCGNEGALLCETFDNLLPESHSTWGDGETTAGLVECEAQAGAGSLRVRAIDGGYTQTRMRLQTPASAGELHTRFYLRVEDGGALPSQLIVFELWDQEEGAVDDRTTVYLNESGALEVFVGASNQTVEAETIAPLPRDQWFCVELSLALDDVLGSASLSVDGEVVLQRTGIDTLPSAPIGVAVVEGVPASGSQNTEVTLYVDELIVGTTSIGCD